MRRRSDGGTVETSSAIGFAEALQSVRSSSAVSAVDRATGCSEDRHREVLYNLLEVGSDVVISYRRSAVALLTLPDNLFHPDRAVPVKLVK